MIGQQLNVMVTRYASLNSMSNVQYKTTNQKNSLFSGLILMVGLINAKSKP